MNNSQIHIRRLEESNKDRAIYFGVVSTIEEAFGTQYPGLYRELRNISRTIASLTEEKTVAGGLIWDKKMEEKYLTVRFVGVSPKFQGKGVGAKLLRSLKDIAMLMKVEGMEGMASGYTVHWCRKNGYKIGRERGKMTTMLKTF